GNWAAKLFARFRVSQRRFVAVNSCTDHAPGNTCTRVRKTGKRRTESGCLGQTIPGRYPAVLEPAFRCARHAQTKLSLDVLCAKPGRILLYDKSAHMPIVILCPNNFNIRNRSIADPALAAVQNVMTTFALGAGFHSAGI